MALEVLRGSLLYCASVRGWVGGGAGLWASRCLPVFVSSPPGKELHQGSMVMLGEILPFGCLNKLGIGRYYKTIWKVWEVHCQSDLSLACSSGTALTCHLTHKLCLVLGCVLTSLPIALKPGEAQQSRGGVSLPEEVPCSPEKWWYNNPSPRLPFCIFGKISSDSWNEINVRFSTLWNCDSNRTFPSSS